jgi:hypothetical protein
MAFIRGSGFIAGTAQSDRIEGSSGADTITPGGGNDLVLAGGGEDHVVFNSEFIRNTVLVTERTGADSLIVRGPEGQDQIEQSEWLHFGAAAVEVDGQIFSEGARFADLADRRYEVAMTVRGVNNAATGNPNNQIEAFGLQADGTIMNTEARDGTIATADLLSDDRGAALFLDTDNDNGRLRLNNVWDANQHLRLGDLDELEFDYFLGGSTRTDVIPVIRLLIDADGDLATTGDRGELVFEWAYQGFGNTTVGVWQTADLYGDDWVAWQRSNGMNWDQVINMTELSDWADADGFTPIGGIRFDEDSLIFGWSVALGSGNGTTLALLDQLEVGLINYDFEFA